MRYAPPQKINAFKSFKKNLLSSAVLLTVSLNCVADVGEIIDKDYLSNDDATGEYDDFRLTITKDEDFSGISLPDFNPPSQQDQYAILVSGAKVNIKGKTYIDSLTDKEGEDPEGTLAITAEKEGEITLDGDVEIYIKQLGITSTHGANALYAKDNSKIVVGNSNSSTTIWTLAEQKADLISAKGGGQVIFQSTKNKLVGNIDMMDEINLGTENSRVDLPISGDGNYWFGDEMSMHNIGISIPDALANRFDIPNYIFGTDEINAALSNPDFETALKLLGYKLQDNKLNQEFNLTISDGAQWTYFGFTKGKEPSGFEVSSIPKRISSITLSNGGIINLFDEDIQKKWKEIGLSELWPELKDINHDYVRIGELKGNGGIFRLDLNSDDQTNSDEQTKSDMIFVESAEAGTHFIEPYRPQDLTSVSDSNRLTFAFTSEKAAGVSFADKQNIYGESLYDYELWISSESITDENKEQFTQLVEENYNDFENFDIDDYKGGKYWFINRLLVKQSAAAIGMRSAGYASYDAAVSMDRHDRRLQDAVFQNENKEGLWTRIQYGEVGAEHLYNADLTTVYVGYETPTCDNNRLGVSFAYTDGNSDFQDLKGSGELKRYEASVYDTLTFGPHYMDFVARFGQVDNEFNVVNQSGALSTSGSFDQKYAAVSAEYGYRLIDTRNVFIEPQLQIQAAYLDDYSYKTERNMRVRAENDVSVIGRAGFRAGKYFRAADKTGELYARADVLHQFTDGQDAKFSDLESQVGVVWGDKDTWATFGVGGYMNWKDNVTVQLDVERTAGGETIDTWQVSGRLNYLF